MMKNVTDLAIEQARLNGGKIATVSKVNINTRHDLSVAYTPGVAAVSSLIAADKRLARELTIKKNTVAVISDGSAVLGLGNIGAEASLPVMEGKAALFKRFANVDSVPIVLDTQNTEEIIRICKAISPTFGGINLEDISAPRCFEIEKRLIAECDIPVFHDDQHGTAIVVLAAVYNSLKLINTNLADVKIVINGGGSAGLSIAKKFLAAGAENIIVVDKSGIISESDVASLAPHHLEIAKVTNKSNLCGTLEDALIDANIFIASLLLVLFIKNGLRKWLINQSFSLWLIPFLKFSLMRHWKLVPI